MKNGLVLGLDGVGKTLLLRQLASYSSKSHKSVFEKLATFASTVSSAAGLTTRAAASVSGYSTSSGSSNNAEDLSDAPLPPGVATAAQRETQPTIGVEHTTLQPLDVVLCEVGAQLLPMWKAYFGGCDFWVFVLDVSSPTQIAGSTIEFFNVLSHEAMRKKPKLLLLNKIDANFGLDDALLRSYLRLDQLLSGADGHLLHVVKLSAATGENLDSVVKWLAQRWSAASQSASPGHHLLPHHSSTSVARADSRVHPVAPPPVATTPAAAEAK